jgi:hypothetical protein
MTASRVPRDRPTIIQYLLLCAAVVVGLGAVLGLLLGTYQGKVEPTYYDAKTFSLHSRVSLNPLVDVKNLLLSRYPFPQPEIAQDPEKTYGIKKAIYDAFLADDTRALIAIANQLSYVAKPDNVLYEEYYDKPYAKYASFDVHEVIDALDTTVLLTAYLFDRLNLRNAAGKYYATYHQAMRMIALPGLDTRFQLVSRRLVAARVKLRLLLDSSVSKERADTSYVDTLIETFLQQTLADKAFSRYRRQGVIYPPAAKKELFGKFSTTNFDPAPLEQTIRAATGPAKNLFVYEYCLSRKFADRDMKDLCSLSSIETMFGRQSFATATLKFALLLHFVNSNPNPDDYDYVMPDGAAAPVLAKNDKNTKLAEQAKQTFESLLSSVGSSLEAESSFLSDDVLFLTYKFYSHFGDQVRATQSLCQIARMRVEDADYVLLAKATVRSKSRECAG